MSEPIESYALLSDGHTAALVSRSGSIDWLCLPRFDSPACFAALLGTEENGYWRIAPAEPIEKLQRRYLDRTLVLETEFTTRSGRVRITDFLTPRDDLADIRRVVRGLEGRVPMRFEMKIRCCYGEIVPWVRRTDRGIRAIAGPDAFLLTSDVPLHGEDFMTAGDFRTAPGEQYSFSLTWYPSHRRPPERVPPADVALRQTVDWWRDWSATCMCGVRDPALREIVWRSLTVIRGLVYQPTGGTVAAPTTSLPEQIGGPRNWDYRYCWIRDAALMLATLLIAGQTREAEAWRDWLVRAAAGRPDQMQVLYGVAGERHTPEFIIDWLDGYEGSRPVRVGNAAYRQFQLDVFGELFDTLHLARLAGIPEDSDAWRVELALAEHLERVWRQPDYGIWEVRGPKRHFTHSKVMAWLAFDRIARSARQFGLPGPADRWEAIRDTIQREVLHEAFNPRLNSFVQYYGGSEVDAALLHIPLVGFLPPDDPRVLGTVERICAELLENGLLNRYRTESGVDGLPQGEGTFLACTCWLAEVLSLLGRRDESERLIERILRIANDLGLLAEEYDPHEGRQLGNYPQAFTHLALTNAVYECCADNGLWALRREATSV